MEEMTKHAGIGMAAMKAGMDRKTASKYLTAGKLPSEMVAPRDWRTRPDPFEEHWPELAEMLGDTPELQARTLFDYLVKKYPGRYESGQLRTLQRHVQRWRNSHGPEREVTLAQRHRPGEAAQTDFTHASALGVTICGVAFVHLLCVFVLPYSNWMWATICFSESIAALRKGIQRALFRLGRVPTYHQTDNSTAATHRIPSGKQKPVLSRKRAFNEEYLGIMGHFGMTPRTTEVGEKEQNGDVEAHNGALKQRLKQALLLRGSRDFESTLAWQSFIDEVVSSANGTRGERIVKELAAMRELKVCKLPEYVEETVRVSQWSTIRVRHCAYSVPSRLMGTKLRVRVYEDRIEARLGDQVELCCERLVGRNLHRIDYRHVIWSLVRKPGGFARYVYREEMFPSLAFRQAYDVIQAQQAGTRGDLEYLRILHRAASGMQSDVEAALVLLVEEGKVISADAVKALVEPKEPTAVPELVAPVVDLLVYDALLGEVAA
ncbi:MAG: IS21 family transposase [Rhodobacteraceae bacterium]|nr:IS21 family transposase [Paracoccaceae bacterium]